MKRTIVKVFTVVVGVVACISLLTVSKASAYDIAFEFLAPQACATVDLRIEITGSGTQVYKEFMDKDGNLIRTLAAGKGWDFLFINLSTAATFPLKGNGSVAHTSYNPDGTYTYTATGHNVIIFFPTVESQNL